jgi:hypothetical protein
MRGYKEDINMIGGNVFTETNRYRCCDRLSHHMNYVRSAPRGYFPNEQLPKLTFYYHLRNCSPNVN